MSMKAKHDELHGALIELLATVDASVGSERHIEPLESSMARALRAIDAMGAIPPASAHHARRLDWIRSSSTTSTSSAAPTEEGSDGLPTCEVP